jgi:hypothetical protein
MSDSDELESDELEAAPTYFNQQAFTPECITLTGGE